MKINVKLVTMLSMAALTAAPLFAQDKPATQIRTINVEPGKPITLDVKPDPTAVPVRVALKGEPSFSNDESKAIISQLSGTWKTVKPIVIPGSNAAGFDVVVSIGPVYVAGMSDVAYVEMARADGLNRPYRHLIWRLVNIRNQWNIQTMEFRRPKGELPSAVGFAAAPTAFPFIAADDLVATMTIPLTNTNGVLAGKTPVAFATRISNAVEMTSEVSISEGKLSVADRGFDASGAQVWGPAEGEVYTLEKTDVGIKTAVLPGGVVTVTYPTELKGEPAKDGEMITVNYAGYLENGTIFDSSYERNTPFTYGKGQRLIDGWTQAMADVQAGMKRRLFVPAALGYGDRARGKIPAASNLIFDMDVLKVEPAPAPTETGVAPAPATAPTAGGNAAQPKLVPTEPPPELKAKMEADIMRQREERMKKQAEAAAKEAEEAAKMAAEEAAKNVQPK